jgi:hypothetical protein
MASPSSPCELSQPTASQSVRSRDSLLDSLQNNARADWDAMKQRIQAAIDPGDGAVGRLRALAREAWIEANPRTRRPANEIGVALNLKIATPEEKERFFDRWTRKLYDVDLITSEFGLDKMDPGTTLTAHMTAHCQQFYTDLLSGKSTLDPLLEQRDTKLTTVAPIEIAAACARVALGNGLPGDGHLTHAALQGQAIYYWGGQQGDLDVIAVEGTESDWNVAGSKLAQICLGDSAAGKDNLKNVILGWVKTLASENTTATMTWKQGNLTTSGILKALQANASQLQIINGEIEKVINKKKPNYMQESDLIELLDGSDAFGKGTGHENCCVTPNAWMHIGAQECPYLQQMGEGSNGRSRFGVLSLDGHQVRETPFEEKFFPRRQSNELLTGCLAEVLTAQHVKPVGSSAAAAGIVSPLSAAELASGAAAGPAAAPAVRGAAARGAGRGRVRGGRAPGSQPAAAGSASAVPEPEAPAARIRCRTPKPQRPLQVTVTTKTVSAMTWDGAAGCVLAGMSQGASAANNSQSGKVGVATVTKHSGKFYGAVAVSNAAIRNGLMRLALGRDVPLDTYIRLLDALAAIPRVELFGVNQFRLERLLAAKTQAETPKALGPAGDDAADVESLPDLTSIEFAARRLFEGLVECKMPVDAAVPAAENTAWHKAVTDGIPFAINLKTFWFNFRQLHFTRKRRRCADLERYCGATNCNAFGDAAGWKKLLNLLVDKRAAETSEDGKRVMLRCDVLSKAWVRSLCLNNAAATAYDQAPAFDGHML